MINLFSLIGVLIRYTRAMTLSTFPSTGVASFPNAMAAIAAAVYGPIPGNFNNSASSFGNSPA